MKKIPKGILIVTGAVVICIVIVLLLLPFQVCRDWAFICENTGSHKGYRQWIFGFETGHWYKKSPLEGFIQSNSPDVLIHRWTSYAGTGKNIFGMKLLFGHGRPGAIKKLDHGVLGQWIEKNDAEAVRKLYDLFVSDDQKAIEKKVTEIWDEFLNSAE